MPPSAAKVACCGRLTEVLGAKHLLFCALVVAACGPVPRSDMQARKGPAYTNLTPWVLKFFFVHTCAAALVQKAAILKQGYHRPD